MSQPITRSLNPEKALIFRVLHRENLPFVLDTGLHCRNSGRLDPNFVPIGNDDVIDKRQRRQVPIPPGGTLSDYVPFYFTPYSPMMYNIRTGWGGIRKRSNDEIVVLVSSLHELVKHEIPFVFTDRQALLVNAQFYSDLASLDSVDFRLLQAKDFKNDPNDPGKMERYMAEALVYRHCPLAALVGVVCYNRTVLDWLDAQIDSREIKGLKTLEQPTWYFQ